MLDSATINISEMFEDKNGTDYGEYFDLDDLEDKNGTDEYLDDPIPLSPHLFAEVLIY